MDHGMILGRATLCVVFLLSSLFAHAALLHETGYYADASRIDGPDFFGEEPEFEEAYKKLRSRYGNDYLPSELPEELWPIRDRIARYIGRENHRAVHGNSRYESGSRGLNNGAGYRFWPSQLPTKITRLSYCFGISPRVLTALIEKESNFIADAQSATGAVGFMQITNVAAVEVLEQLGYPNPYVAHNEKAAQIYKSYISCYLGEDREWVDPWEKSQSTRTERGGYIVNPQCSEAFRNCSRGSKKLRTLKDPYEERFDKWLTGRIPGSSHDNGLIFGAVLLKFHIGHYGFVTGVENYNGDSVKKSYRRTILGKAINVNSSTFEYELFGNQYQIFHNGSEDRLQALDVLKKASQLWQEGSGNVDPDLDQELRGLELPGARTKEIDI